MRRRTCRAGPQSRRRAKPRLRMRTRFHSPCTHGWDMSVQPASAPKSRSNDRHAAVAERFGTIACPAATGRTAPAIGDRSEPSSITSTLFRNPARSTAALSRLESLYIHLETSTHFQRGLCDVMRLGRWKALRAFSTHRERHCGPATTHPGLKAWSSSTLRMHPSSSTPHGLRKPITSSWRQMAESCRSCLPVHRPNRDRRRRR